MFVYLQEVFTYSVQMYIRAFLPIVNFFIYFIYVTMPRFLSDLLIQYTYEEQVPLCRFRNLTKKLLTVLHSFFAGCHKFLGILSVPLMLSFPKTFFGLLFHKEALTLSFLSLPASHLFHQGLG